MNVNQNMMGVSHKNLSVYKLKLIAIISMFIDHLASIVLTTVQSSYGQTESSFFWFQLLIVLMRLVGRLAFPIFAYLIVNGFYHTSHRKKYVLRLFIFGIISEPFFDFGATGYWFDTDQQNVMFTLGLGLGAIWGYDHFSKEENRYYNSNFIVIIIAFFAQLLHTDYGFYGIMSIFIMYLYFNDFKRLSFMMIGLNLLLYGSQLSTWTSFNHSELSNVYDFRIQVMYYLLANAQLFSLLALGVLKNYNGEKGKLFNKYFFYLFYPIHLFLLGIVALLLKG